jgi:hypothetical protein
MQVEGKEDLPMTMLLGVLGGIMIARILIRGRMRRAWAHGGCRRFGGPIDLGAPDRPARYGELPRFFRRGWRWQPWQPGSAAARAPAVDVATALELNGRQKELYDDVMARAKLRVSAAALAEVLIAVGREPFGRDAVELLVGPGDLADDFEQLHHSLTPEQREKLCQVTGARR